MTPRSAPKVNQNGVKVNLRVRKNASGAKNGPEARK
jgi:hypothetical protein